MRIRATLIILLAVSLISSCGRRSAEPASESSAAREETPTAVPVTPDTLPGGTECVEDHLIVVTPGMAAPLTYRCAHKPGDWIVWVSTAGSIKVEWQSVSAGQPPYNLTTCNGTSSVCVPGAMLPGASVGADAYYKVTFPATGQTYFGHIIIK